MSEEKKPGQAMTFAFRHLPTGQGYAEWRVWLDGAGYDFDDDSYQAEAFAAGMRAAPDLADDLCAERKQVTELREVLTEIFTCLDAGDPALLDDEQKAEWRQRARMEAQQ